MRHAYACSLATNSFSAFLPGPLLDDDWVSEFYKIDSWLIAGWWFCIEYWISCLWVGKRDTSRKVFVWLIYRASNSLLQEPGHEVIYWHTLTSQQQWVSKAFLLQLFSLRWSLLRKPTRAGFPTACFLVGNLAFAPTFCQLLIPSSAHLSSTCVHFGDACRMWVEYAQPIHLQSFLKGCI